MDDRDESSVDSLTEDWATLVETSDDAANLAPPFSLNNVKDVPDEGDEFDRKHWLTDRERELPFEKEAAALGAEAMDTRE